MKKYLLLALLMLFITELKAQLHISPGSNLSLKNGVVLRAGSDISILGSLESDKRSGITGSNSDSLKIVSSDSIKLGYLGIDNPDGLFLSTKLAVDSLIEFFSGHLLSTSDIELSKTAVIHGYDSSQFIVNTTGDLIYKDIDAASLIFPLGSSKKIEDYSPAIIDGPIGSATLAMRVVDGAWASYSPNLEPSGLSLESSFIKQTWFLHSSKAISNLDLSLEYNANKEGSVYNSAFAFFSKYNSATNSWAVDTSVGSVSGTNPFLLSGKTNVIGGVEIISISSLLDLIQSTKNKFCEGDSVRLWTQNTATFNYQWRRNGVPILAATDTSFWTKSGGTYDVLIINGNDTLQTVPIDIRKFDNPVLSLRTSDLKPCPGDTVSLIVPAINTWTYSWARNATPIASTNRPELRLNQSGLYSVSVTDLNGCNSIIDSIEVQYRISPRANISGPGKLCFGDTANLMAPDSMNYSYSWLFNGITAPGKSDSSSYITSLAGPYQVLITDSFGCKAISTIFSVQKESAPVPIPAIVASNIWFCEGDSLLLRESQNVNFNRSWLFNGNPSGTIDSFLWASAQGSYELVYSVGGRCSEKSPAFVISQIDTANATVWANGISTFCQGDSLELRTNFGSDYSYKWLRNSQIITGSDSSLFVNQSGTYTAQVSILGNCPVLTNGFEVFKSKLDTSRISLIGNDSICSGDSVIFEAAPKGKFSYQWYRNSNLLDSSGSHQLMADQSGSYWFNVLDAAGCNLSSDSINLHVRAPLNMPVISRRMDSLFSNTTNRVQWYRNGLLLNGSNQSYYPLDSNGYYHFISTDSFGCQISSDTILVQGLYTKAFISTEVLLFPNPNSGLFRLQNSGVNLDMSIEIRTIEGKLVFSRSNYKAGTELRTELTSGIYLLIASDYLGNRSISRFSVIEH